MTWTGRGRIADAHTARGRALSGMRTRTLTLSLSPLLLLCCMGSTDCDAYSEVTVPTWDPTAPATYDGPWASGGFQVLAGPGETASYRIEPGQQVLAISSALDDGGVRDVTMYATTSYLCCVGTTCTRSDGTKRPLTDSQPGGPGSTASNGLWVGTGVTLPTCRTGYTLASFVFSWQTVATNFSGVRATSKLHAIHYP